MNKKLLPCPFCGGEIYSTIEDSPEDWYPHTYGCVNNCYEKTEFQKTKSEAIAAANIRDTGLRDSKGKVIYNNSRLLVYQQGYGWGGAQRDTMTIGKIYIEEGRRMIDFGQTPPDIDECFPIWILDSLITFIGEEDWKCRVLPPEEKNG